MNEEKRHGGIWLILAILALIWGSSFILMKRGLYHDGVPVLTSWQVATARLSIAWLALSPMLFRHIRLLPKHWLPLLAAGLLGNGIPAFLFATAQTRIASALSGMLNGLTPLMTLLTGALFFATRVRGVHVFGIILGLAGAAGLIAFNSKDGLPSWSLYALMPIAGTLCYGFNGNIVKKYLYMLPAQATSALALTWVGPVSIGLALSSGLPEVLRTNPHAWRALGYVAILAVMGSAIALVLWNLLLKRTSALRASTVTYLIPVVAIGWGWKDGEAIVWQQLGMIGLVLTGVYIVSVAERK